MGRRVVPLTMELLYKKGWNEKEGTGKWLTVYWGQTYGGEGLGETQLTTTSKDLQKAYIMPTGSLISRWGAFIRPPSNGTVYREFQRVVKDWLPDSKGRGPYKDTDGDDGYIAIWYYTPCYVKSEQAERDVYFEEFQICSGPLNVLSYDCMDEVNFYVTK